jgi:heme/copper-type cytochrome/quinol oxidase subunit 2
MSGSTRTRRGALACGILAVGLLGAGCTTTAGPQNNPSPPVISTPTSTSSPAESQSSVPPSPPSLNPEYPLTINIVIAKGKTIPSGEKIDVRVGQKVIMNVISDSDDEIHAHTDGAGYEMQVQAGRPTKGSFTIKSPGSFEVESHHLEKIIVILNAR